MSRTSVGTPVLFEEEPEGAFGPYGSLDDWRRRRTLIVFAWNDLAVL